MRMKLAAAGIALVFAISLIVAWRALRQEQAQLQERLKSAEQSLKDASTQQADRDAGLGQILKAIQAQKKAVQSPDQVVRALPEVLPLPTALRLEAAAQANGSPPTTGRSEGRPLPGNGTGSAVDVVSPKVQIPAEDLKPLYDFALDCKACKAQLATAQSDLKDEKTKTEALGRERDAALQAARGGSVLRRVARAAKWFAIGAAAGAVAAKLAH